MQKHLVQSLSTCLQMRQPAILWGDPGLAKTDMISAMCRDFNRPVFVEIASLKDLTDFAGIPYPKDDTVWMLPLKTAREVATTKDAVLFFDDISTASPSVQNALMRIVLQREWADLKLGDSVSIVAAANPPSPVTACFNLTAQLANRLVHIPWEVDEALWQEGMNFGFKVPKTLAVNPEWEKGKQHKRRVVSSFHKQNPGKVKVVPTDPKKASLGWPSPRSWTMMADLWAGAESAHCDSDGTPPALDAWKDERATIFTGCVGTAAATEFDDWLVKQDLPDPELLLREPQQFVPGATPDITVVILSAVVAAISRNCTAERWRQGWRILGRMGEFKQLDLGGFAAMEMRAIQPKDPSLTEDPPAEISKYSSLFIS